MVKKDDVDRLKQIEGLLQKIEIENGIRSGIRLRCIAFWSSVVAFFGAIGAWCVEHIDAVSAGFKAFWVVLWAK